jgi:uncharacterized protein
MSVSTSRAFKPSLRKDTGPSANLELKPSAIHGQGGFATAPISKGTRVIEYVGERITKSESIRRCQEGNPFIFHLDDTFDLDGNTENNPARWINHSCAPNCDAECLEGCIWLVANRDIQRGEEITFDYGFDLIDYRDHPCHCGAEHCHGFIVAQEFWNGSEL